MRPIRQVWGVERDFFFATVMVSCALMLIFWSPAGNAVIFSFMAVLLVHARNHGWTLTDVRRALTSKLHLK